MSERKFKGICPKCHNKIIASDNWGKGTLIIMGFCKTCQLHYSEDEIDWERRKNVA